MTTPEQIMVAIEWVHLEIPRPFWRHRSGTTPTTRLSLLQLSTCVTGGADVWTWNSSYDDSPSLLWLPASLSVRKSITLGIVTRLACELEVVILVRSTERLRQNVINGHFLQRQVHHAHVAAQATVSLGETLDKLPSSRSHGVYLARRGSRPDRHLVPRDVHLFPELVQTVPARYGAVNLVAWVFTNAQFIGQLHHIGAVTWAIAWAPTAEGPTE